MNRARIELRSMNSYTRALATTPPRHPERRYQCLFCHDFIDNSSTIKPLCVEHYPKPKPYLTLAIHIIIYCAI